MLGLNALRDRAPARAVADRRRAALIEWTLGAGDVVAHVAAEDFLILMFGSDEMPPGERVIEGAGFRCSAGLAALPG